MLSGRTGTFASGRALHYFMRTPVPLAPSFFIDLRNRTGNDIPDADEPAADGGAGESIEHARRIGGIQRRGFVAVRHEHDVGSGLGRLRSQYRPVNALGDFTGVGPAHASVDLRDRS